jgi:alkylhydroperoxidase family enzyme
VPLPEADWDPRLDGVLARLDPVLNVHRVLAHHPDLLAAWSSLRHHIAFAGSLLPRHRELLILRIAHRAGSGYEWHHHVIRGRAAGLSDDEIAAIGGGRTGDWTEIDGALLSAADELFDSRSIGQPTWAALAGGLSQEQLLDVVMTVGVYVTLAMVIAATGVSIEA